MIEQAMTAWSLPRWLAALVLIGLFFLSAWLIHRLSGRMAGRLVTLSRFASRTQGRALRPERRTTLRGLIANSISFLAFVVALLATLGLFISTDSLVWMVGLFSAAFGLGARPMVNDFLTGLGFIFEDIYDVGEKVEIMGTEGVVEAVRLRTTYLRSPTGELYVVPNGDVRLIRNFSRGRFSAVQVKLKIEAADLASALAELEEMKEEAVVLLPNLLEPWQVISESGVMGQQTELTLLAKARFGKGAEMRPRLLALVQERMTQADVDLVG